MFEFVFVLVVVFVIEDLVFVLCCLFVECFQYLMNDCVWYNCLCDLLWDVECELDLVLDNVCQEVGEVDLDSSGMFCVVEMLEMVYQYWQIYCDVECVCWGVLMFVSEELCIDIILDCQVVMIWVWVFELESNQLSLLVFYIGNCCFLSWLLWVWLVL